MLLELLILCFSIVILPLYDTRTLMKSYQTESSFLLVGISGVLLVLYSIKIMVAPRSTLKIKITQTDILLFTFLAYLSLNRYFVSHFQGYTLKYFQIICLAFLYITVRSIPKVYQKYLIFSIMFSGILQAIYGNLQLYNVYPSNHHLFSITGSFFNPGPYAGYLAMIFPIALVIYFKESTKKRATDFSQNTFEPGNKLHKETKANLKFFQMVQKLNLNLTEYFSLITLLTILLVLPATRSRAGWLAAIISSFFVVVKLSLIRNLIKNILNSKTKRFLAELFILLLVSGFVFGIYFMKKDSADGRLLIWKITSRMIKDRPLTGFGNEKFQAHYMDYQAEYFEQNPDSKESYVADNITYPFNEYLKVFSELGITGFILILIIPILIITTRNYEKDGEGLIISAKVGVMSLAIFSFFSYPSEILPVLINLVVLLAIVSSQIKVPRIILANRDQKDYSKIRRRLKYIIAGISLTIIIAASKPIKNLYKAYWTWDEAYQIYRMGMYEESIKSFEIAYEQLRENGEFLVMYGKALSMAGKPIRAKEILNDAVDCLENTILFTALGDSYKILNDVDRSEEAYLKAYYMIPSRFYPKYLLAKLYFESGKYKQAVSTAQELLNKEEKVHSTAIEEIREEMEEIIKKIRYTLTEII